MNNESPKELPANVDPASDHVVVINPFEGICEAILASGGNTKWPESQTIDGLELRCTCRSHPEQYDVYDGDDQVAYFRLRHGCFRVDIPVCGGETIYDAETNGDGLFDANERQQYLTEAVAAVKSRCR